MKPKSFLIVFFTYALTACNATNNYRPQIDTYNPELNREFQFLTKKSEADYDNFCYRARAKDCGVFYYNEMVGKRGYFDSQRQSEEVEEDGVLYIYRAIVLPAGERAYYKTKATDDGYWGNGKDIKPIWLIESEEEEHQKQLNAEKAAKMKALAELKKEEEEVKRKALYKMEPELLAPNSELMLVEKADSSYGSMDAYKLSNGTIQSKEYIALIRRVSNMLGNKKGLADMLTQVDINEDSFDGRFFIKPYDSYERSFYRIGFTVTNGKAHPTLYAEYRGYDWIFANGIKVKADNSTWDFSNLNFDRNNNGYGVWEIAQKVLTENHMKLNKKLANADQAMVRFYGDSHASTITIDGEMLEKLKWSVKFYELVN